MTRRQLTEIERTRECPWCHAQPGERCTGPDGRPANVSGGYHAARRGLTAGTDGRQQEPGGARKPRKRRYAFTRDSLIDALTRLETRVMLTGPIAGMINAESMADAIIEALGQGK